MKGIEALIIYSDETGCSRFGKKTVELEEKDYAPPAPALYTSSLESAENAVFLALPAGWFGNWHPTPVRQWLIVMTGACEFEAGDGERATCKAGDAVLLEDTTGRGHRTRVVGDEAVRIAAVHLSRR